MKYGTVDQFLEEFDVSLEWRIQIIHQVASAMFYLTDRNQSLFTVTLLVKIFLLVTDSVPKLQILVWLAF